jgi:uncharacterized protein YidB (DUF937 family)
VNVSIPTGATGGVLGSATSTGVASAHRRHGGSEKTIKAVADELQMSPADLKKELASGKSLADVASAKGVSKDDLVSTIASTLPSTAPDGTTIDTTARATQIADSTRQAPPPRAGSGPNDGATDIGTGIDTLAGALGISSDDLLQRLTDGTGIADLLSANPSVSSQLSGLQNKGALVDGYA